MEDSVKQKIRETIEMARVQNIKPGETPGKLRADFPNTLADNIKTAEQARVFWLLLKSL